MGNPGGGEGDGEQSNGDDVNTAGGGNVAGDGAGGSGGDEPGDGGRDTAIVDPIDVDDYRPEQTTACQPTNPCPAGQCAEDTHPCVGKPAVSRQHPGALARSTFCRCQFVASTDAQPRRVEAPKGAPRHWPPALTLDRRANAE